MTDKREETRQRIKVKKFKKEKTDRTLTSVMFMCNSNESMDDSDFQMFQKAIDMLIHDKLTNEDETEEVCDKDVWFSGRIADCHSADPSSILGTSYFYAN